MHDYVDFLGRTLKKLNAVAKVHSDESKERAAGAYRSRMPGAGCWLPFSVGSRVRYRNRYPDRNNRKFSDRYIGPFTVLVRKGVVYKVSLSGRRAKWIHHDDLLPWRGGEDVPELGETRTSGEAHRVLPGRGAPEGSGVVCFSSDEQEGDSDGGSESTSEESEYSTSERESRAHSVVIPRHSGRERRPPVWLRDSFLF